MLLVLLILLHLRKLNSQNLAQSKSDYEEEKDHHQNFQMDSLLTLILGYILLFSNLFPKSN